MVLATNKIICGNNIEVLSEEAFPNECIDLTVTSPPYDELRDYKGYEFNFTLLVQELYRVTKQGGIVVWIVGDSTVNGSETGSSFNQALYFKGIGFNLHDTMIYAKKGFPFPSTNRYHQTFEYMFVFSKGKPKTFNPIEDKKVKWERNWGENTKRNQQGGLEIHKDRKSKEFCMRYNVWEYAVGKGNSTRDEIAYQHPAIFPEQLAADHIRSWSNEGDLVLDPMCGSGTTPKMAAELNRKYIGIDISPEYCKLTKKRLSWDNDVYDLAATLSIKDFSDLVL